MLPCRIRDSRVSQRYLCENCDRTFDDQTGTVFERSAVAFGRWLHTVYIYIRLNTSLRQLDVEIELSYKTIYQRVQRLLREPRIAGATLAPAASSHLEGQVDAVSQGVPTSLSCL
jgi:transposase-like protein